jgi:hypothetical protein
MHDSFLDIPHNSRQNRCFSQLRAPAGFLAELFARRRSGMLAGFDGWQKNGDF